MVENSLGIEKHVHLDWSEMQLREPICAEQLSHSIKYVKRDVLSQLSFRTSQCVEALGATLSGSAISPSSLLSRTGRDHEAVCNPGYLQP